MYFLNLPTIPENIQHELITFVDEYIKTWTPVPDDAYRQIYGDLPINYAKRKVVVGFKNDKLTKFINDVCPLIIRISLFIMDNQGEGIAVMPPHTDFDRTLAVNYVLQTGGDNVVTTIYKKPEDSEIVIRNGFVISRYFHQDKLEKDKDYILKKDTWPMFDCQVPHSVQNIETRRVMISMTMPYTSEQVVEKFPELILC